MFKLFQNNTALTAEDLNDVLMEQAVITFADATERNNAIPSPNPGMHVHLLSTKRTYYYDATGGWIELMPGMVSGLTQRGILVCTSTTRPAHAIGRMIYETDTKITVISDGTTWHPQREGYVMGRADLTGGAGANNAIGYLTGEVIYAPATQRRAIISVTVSFYQPTSGTLSVWIERVTNSTSAVNKTFGKRGIRTGGTMDDLAHYNVVLDDVVAPGTWRYRVCASASGATTNGGYVITDPGASNHLIIQDGGPA